MATKTKKVTLSDYLKSRQYNHKLYARLVKRIESNCANLFEQHPAVEIEISMSAKYQTPYVKITENETTPSSTCPIGFFEQQIIEAIDYVGFSETDVEQKSYGYIIGFAD